MSELTDILIDSNAKDAILRDGDFVTGDSLDQEVELILSMEQGELKEDPMLGAGLIRLVHSNGNELSIRQLASVHLARDGKSYDDIKKRIKLNEKND